jgi:hypothetical protein
MLSLVALLPLSVRAADDSAKQEAWRPVEQAPTIGKVIPDSPKQHPISGSEEIYDNVKAFELVLAARKVDPLYCAEKDRDRDMAANLYEQAIGAQPGAKINAQLANRIAQMYAFFEDRPKNVRPIPERAHQWWTRCLELTNSRQLIWSQAQMGLASVSMIGGNPRAVLDRYDEILRVDVSKMELDNWKVWPEGDSEGVKAIRARDLETVGRHMKELQATVKKKRSDLEKQIEAREGRNRPEPQ